MTSSSACSVRPRAVCLAVICGPSPMSGSLLQATFRDSDKLSKESACGPRWRTFSSFCDTDVINNFFSFFRSEEVSFRQLHSQVVLGPFYCADSPEGWGGVHLMGLACWADWMVGGLVTAHNTFSIPDMISMISRGHKRPGKTHKWWVRVKPSGTGIQHHKRSQCHQLPAFSSWRSGAVPTRKFMSSLLC